MRKSKIKIEFFVLCTPGGLFEGKRVGVDDSTGRGSVPIA